MANVVEDMLVYKTLEPSKRPTVQDVAQNSYLGLLDNVWYLFKIELTFCFSSPVCVCESKREKMAFCYLLQIISHLQRKTENMYSDSFWRIDSFDSFVYSTSF